MKRNTKILLGSLGALILAGGALAAVLLFAPAPQGEEESSNETVQLVTKKQLDVASVSIETGGQTTVIEPDPNSAGNFYIKDLAGLPKNSSKYNAVTKAVAELSAQKMVTEKADDLSQYGLSDPRSKVVVSYTDEKSLTLLLGDEAPSGEGVYMRLEGKDAVYISSTIIKNSLFSTKVSFIDTTVVAGVSEENQPTVKRVEFGGTVREQKIVLEHTPTNTNSPVGATEYSITEPIQGYVNSEYTNNIFSSFFGLYATGVNVISPSAEQLTEYGFDNPYSTLYLLYDDQEYTLRVGKEWGDFYYLMRDGVDLIYQVAKDSLPWAGAGIADFHARMLFTPSISEVASVTVETPGKSETFTLTHTGSEIAVAHNGETLDVKNFQRFYQVLITTKSDEDAGAITNDTSLLKLTFRYLSQGKDPLVIEFRETGARNAAATVDGKTQFQVKMTYIDKVVSDLDKLLRGEDITVNW